MNCRFRLLRPKAGRHRLAVQAGQDGLGIEGIHMAGAALQEDQDDVLGVRLKVRLLWGARGLASTTVPAAAALL